MYSRTYLKLTLTVLICAVFALVSQSAIAKIIYVDPHGNNTDGTSWMYAYHHLQDAISAAAEGDEIRIAQGTYTPDKSNANPEGTKDMDASFELKSGLIVQGGYAGITGQDPAEYDPEQYNTILSGDLLGNDQAFSDYVDNSAHIMKAVQLPTKVILEGLTFQSGDAKGAAAQSGLGGGLFISESLAEIKRCTFKYNYANDDTPGVEGGAGIYLYKSNDTVISDCTFLNNRGKASGAIEIGSSEQVYITDCYFQGNVAISDSSIVGDAIRTSGSAKICNSTFFQNGYSAYYTGRVVRRNTGELEVMNCRFIENDGGPGSASHFINCLFVGNKVGTVQYSAGLEADKITNCTAGKNDIRIQCNDLSNSIIWGTSITWINQSESQISSRNCIKDYSEYYGNDTINLDPLFVDYDGPDNIAGTADDDLRLTIHSPCIDAGNNQLVPFDNMDIDQDGDIQELLPLDIDNKARFKDVIYTQDTGLQFTDPYYISTPVVDMGCFETEQAIQLRVSEIPELIEEGSECVFQISLSEDPQGQVDLSVLFEGGDSDIQVVSGNSITFDSQNYSMPQAVQLKALEDDDTLGDISHFEITSQQIPVYKFSIREHDNEPAPIIYVDSKATGNQDGFSWENAYQTISSALEFANEYEEITEIRMAEGTYYPGYQTFPSPTFVSVIQLPFLHGMSIHGGYAGNSGNDPNERDPEIHQTTIYRCELMHFIISSEESVNFDELKMDAVPDIRSGFKGVPNIMFNNCFIEERNSTTNKVPGGAWIGPAIITFNNCTFQEIGGGQEHPNNGLIDISSGNMVHYNNCIFKDMGDSYRHSFYFDQQSHITFTGCLFDDVEASVFRDKAVFYCVDNSHIAMKNCGIINCKGLNILEAEVNSDVDLDHCTLVQNYIDRYLIDTSGSLSFRNSIIWGNEDDYYGNPKINVLAVHSGAFDHTCFEYSNIESGKRAFAYGIDDKIWGQGNIDYDPLFLNLSSVTGGSDLHLSIDSPCIDMGDPSNDFSKEPEPTGGRVNIGFYGNTPEAAVTLDSDNDGYLNGQESRWGLDPHNSDSDEDGLSDFFEAGYDGDPNNYNPFDYQTQSGTDLNANVWDTDNDALSDFNEVMVYFTNPFVTDSDNDGLLDGEEVNVYGSEPLDNDTDNDGMPDGWEIDNGLNLLENDAELDADNDDLTNLEDYLKGCRADNPDSDEDGMEDGWEVENSLNPIVDDSLEDYDNDGFVNIDEKTKNTQPDDPLSFPTVYTFYVDDDAPNDPGSADPAASDPLEDGSLEHPFDSIPEAIDHLLTLDPIKGDKIIVLDGHYPCLTLSGITQPIHIESLNGSEACILETGACSILNCDQREIVIQGFTIHQDNQMQITNSIVSLIDSVVEDGPSRGVWVQLGCLVGISNCEIQNNRYEGILLNGMDSTLIIEDSTIRGNQQGAVRAGGENSTLEIYRSIITENNGYGVWAEDSAVVMSNCLVYANDHSDYTSLPVYLKETSSSRIENCTISYNISDRVIYMSNCGSDNIITNTIATKGQPNDYYPTVNAYNSEVEITYSHIAGGWEGEGNVDSDPLLFFDEQGLIRIAPDSPCVNTGDPNYINVGQTDCLGNPRVLYDRIDMGAIEYSRLPGDMEPDDDVDSDDLLAFAGSWLQPVSGYLSADFNDDAFVNMEDFSLLSENWCKHRYLLYGAHWTFDNEEGRLVEDSLNTWDGVTVNMDNSNWCDGIKGKALEFDGQQEYVQLPNNLVLEVSDFTILGWINLYDSYNTSYICGFGTHSQNKVELYSRSSQLYFRCYGSNCYVSIVAPMPASSYPWHFVAVTLEGNTFRLYCDGQEISSADSQGFRASDLGLTNQNYIGRSIENSGFFKGIIDDFRFYPYCVTELEITDEYAEIMDELLNSTVLLNLPFEEGSGLSTQDHSQNAIECQLINMDDTGWTNGYTDYGLYFNGLDQYLEIPSFNESTYNMTLSAWIKTDGQQDSEYFALKVKQAFAA